jgi:hypothetical protein
MLLQASSKTPAPWGSSWQCPAVTRGWRPGRNLQPPTHEVEYHLITAGRPMAAHFRCLDPEKHESARSAFAKLEQQRIIQRSNSCWAWPLYMVHRMDGSWQPCCEFRQLNLITEPDKFTLPRMDEPGWPPQGMQHLYEAGLEAGLSSDPHG